MKQNFIIALEKVLKHEGGWADNPADPGGATMKGVTLKTFRSFFGSNQSKEDLRNISPEQLQHIYKTGYWDKCKCDKLPNGIDYVVFDAAVNSGPKQASKWLQRAVGSNADGIVGPNTINAILDYNKPNTNIVYEVCYQRLRFMQRLKIWSNFGKGWSSRVLEVLYGGLELERNY